MTDQQLADIKARCEAASDDLWEAEEGVPREIYDFIAHARTDIPALLDEVERLKKEIDRLESQRKEIFKDLEEEEK